MSAHKCECGRGFDTPQGLALHQRRVRHGQYKGTQAAPKAKAAETDSLRFCPCCGANIALLRRALAVAQRLGGK